MKINKLYLYKTSNKISNKIGGSYLKYLKIIISCLLIVLIFLNTSMTFAEDLNDTNLTYELDDNEIIPESYSFSDFQEKINQSEIILPYP